MKIHFAHELQLTVILHGVVQVVDGLTFAQARRVFFFLLFFLLFAWMCHNVQRVVPLLEFSLQARPYERLEFLGSLFVVQIQRERFSEVIDVLFSAQLWNARRNHLLSLMRLGLVLYMTRDIPWRTS